MDTTNREALRAESAERFRDPQDWRSQALRLHRETDLSIVDIAKRVGVGKNRVAALLKGRERSNRPSTVKATAALARAKRHAGVIKVGGTFVRRVARTVSRQDREKAVDVRRERLHRMLVADQGRISPPVTLPRVSILEGVDR